MRPPLAAGAHLQVRPPLPAGPYLVVGLARSGTAVAKALNGRGERVVGFDSVATAAVEELRALGIAVAVGGNGVELLDRVACVVKSPGVPREAPVVAAALERSVPLLGELELAWRLLPQELVAVTGTNGKTTTVELIGQIHRAAGLAVELAGNVGRALSELVLEPPGAAATIVCEASSFQLEDTIDFAPDAAVLLNLSEDHLDRHHSFHSYKEAKLRIFANQEARAIAVLPEALAELHRGAARQVLFGAAERCALRLADGALCWGSQPLLELDALRLRAPLEDAMAAAAVALARGLPIEAVRDALRTFRGVAHRLEEVATIDGVAYVNDSKATNVASALAALATFAPGSVQLILGGQGKGQDFRPLRDAAATTAAHVYLIGEAAPELAAALEGLPVTHAGDLEQAVARAQASASPGQTILLSPACASFDQFRDFEARGDAFRALITGQA